MSPTDRCHDCRKRVVRRLADDPAFDADDTVTRGEGHPDGPRYWCAECAPVLGAKDPADWWKP